MGNLVNFEIREYSKTNKGGEYNNTIYRTNYLLEEDELTFIKKYVVRGVFDENVEVNEFNFTFKYKDGIENRYLVSTSNGVVYMFTFNNVETWYENFEAGEFVRIEPMVEESKEEVETSTTTNVDKFDFREYVCSQPLFTDEDEKFYKHLMKEIIGYVQSNEYIPMFIYDTKELYGITVRMNFALNEYHRKKFQRWIEINYSHCLSWCDVYEDYVKNNNGETITNIVVVLSWEERK